MPKVYFSILEERAILETPVSTLFNVSMQAGNHNYTRIELPYMRTDVARNIITKAFMEVDDPHPLDRLVMLDDDHNTPPHIIERLVVHDVPIVAPLMFRRGPPYDPLFFVRCADGMLHAPVTWVEGLYECDAVGSGAISIQRYVFESLDVAGYHWPFFRYTYEDYNKTFPSEDIFFCRNCEAIGIKAYCDTTIELPHMVVGQIDKTSWAQWVEDHPDILAEGEGKGFTVNFKVQVAAKGGGQE